MLHLDKVTENQAAFGSRVQEIARGIGVPADWLMQIMYTESRFNPKAQNRVTGAVGLIQFMPATARNVLKLEPEQILAMNNLQQLDLVERFYRIYTDGGGRFRQFSDLYMWAFRPVVLYKKQPDSTVLPDEVIRQNALDKVNVRTVGEWRAYVTKKAQQANAASRSFTPTVQRRVTPDTTVSNPFNSNQMTNNTNLLIIGGTVLAIGLYLYLK
jgi:hypothetical protein